MATITAQNILDENNYPDMSKTIVEYLIDNVINYLNLETGLSISNMTGDAESKSVTVTSGQSAIIKPLAALMIRAYKDRGPNASVGGLSVVTVLADPQYTLFKEITNKGINRLRGRSFVRT